MFILHSVAAMTTFAIGLGVWIVPPIRAAINKEQLGIIDIALNLLLGTSIFCTSSYQIYLLYLLIQKGS